jgi:hypothetical protein
MTQDPGSSDDAALLPLQPGRGMLCIVMDLKQIDSDPVSDTSARAAAVQLSLYRKAGPAARVRVAVELSDAVRETALSGIRRRHPEYSERDVALSFLRLVYGLGNQA